MKALILLLVLGMASVGAMIQPYVVNKRCDLTAATTVSLNWSPFPSAMGMYEIEGCEGYSPTIVLSAGVEYTFEQYAEKNWMHAIGFSYVAGGAHAECLKNLDTATSAGSCYFGGALKCDIGEEECKGYVGSWFEPDYISGRSGCCLCAAGCDHELERPQEGGVLCEEKDGVYYDADDVTTECPEIETDLSYYRNDIEVGLDGYEPEFFWPISQWVERGPYKAVLKFPADVSFTRAYYFCHIHNGMSAEIEIVGSSDPNPTILNSQVLGGETEESALLIYTGEKIVYQTPIESQAELECGTSSGKNFASPDGIYYDGGACEKNHYLCGETDEAYEQCLKMTDCEMHYDMAISVPETTTSKFATFARQMIPHHQNAVAMSKILLKFQEESDYPAAMHSDLKMPFGTDLALDIINQQNMQIQSMQGWLDDYDEFPSQPVSKSCYEDELVALTSTRALRALSALSAPFAPSERSEPAVAATIPAYEVNLPCDLTSTTPKVLSVSWSAFLSEVGMYSIDGCVGYNPKIELSAGIEYTFEQYEQENWMHAIGFSYVAGGAHAECLKDPATATSAGSCYTHGSTGGISLTCDTAEADCAGSYYAPGYVSERGGCCHCAAGCDHELERPQEGGVLCEEKDGVYYDADDVTTECPEIETDLSYYRNDIEVGLDGYEPEFFWPISQWVERGPYKAVLKFPADVSFTRAYYFCHIHNGMSAEIEIVGSSDPNPTILNSQVLGGETEQSALLIYDSEKAVYQKPIESQAELECGTSSGKKFAPPPVQGSLHDSQCSRNQYLCGAVDQVFEQCLMMTGCEMHTNMAVDVPDTNTSRFATFARQMIPHHQNAVAMSKILLKHQGYGEDKWDDYPKHLHPEYYQPFGSDLAQDIINQQNMQIQDLRNWLGVYEELTVDTQPSNELCYILYPSPNDNPAAGLVLHSGVGVIVALVASLIVMAV